MQPVIVRVLNCYNMKKLKQEPGVHMYKVVIVDDEPIIAEGLSKVVPWEKWAGGPGGHKEGAAQYGDIRYFHAGHGRPENDCGSQSRIS